MAIETAIVTELSAVTGLSGKVFPIVAQQNTVVPYVTYKLVDSERKRILTSPSGLVEAPYQIDVFHSSYSALKLLTDAIIAELKTWEQTNLGITGEYVQAIEISEGIETFDDETNLYQGTIDIHLSYNET
jgi:hypothetical protein